MNEAGDGSPWLPCGVWSFDRWFSGPKLDARKMEVFSRPLSYMIRCIFYSLYIYIFSSTVMILLLGFFHIHTSLLPVVVLDQYLQAILYDMMSYSVAQT